MIDTPEPAALPVSEAPQDDLAGELIAALEPLLDNADGYDISVVRALVRQSTDSRRQEWLEAEERARIAWKSLKAACAPPTSTSQDEPKWVTAARKLVKNTRLIKTGDGVHLLEMAVADYDAASSSRPPAPQEVPSPPAQATLSLHRCKVCGTRWLLWPESVHGGGWNLLDKYSRPGACCDNAAMGDQIEHLRDIPLTVSGALPSPPAREDRQRVGGVIGEILDGALAEHTRAILRYTAKGYAAGENADSKAWRQRAEKAEAELAAVPSPPVADSPTPRRLSVMREYISIMREMGTPADLVSLAERVLRDEESKVKLSAPSAPAAANKETKA